ncbi:hypothetical protein D3C76_1266580 [compost metagenome]
MSSSASSTVSIPPLPVTFSLNVYGGAARRLDKELVPNPSDEIAMQRAAKRKAQHEVEMLALEWNKVMLERHIHEALDPKTDARLRRDLRNDVLNRGIGRVRTQEDDEDAKKKGGTVADLIEVLAAFSVVASAAQDRGAAPRIERDIGGGGTDEDFQQLLDDIDAEENDRD